MGLLRTQFSNSTFFTSGLNSRFWHALAVNDAEALGPPDQTAGSTGRVGQSLFIRYRPWEWQGDPAPDTIHWLQFATFSVPVPLPNNQTIPANTLVIDNKGSQNTPFYDVAGGAAEGEGFVDVPSAQLGQLGPVCFTADLFLVSPDPDVAGAWIIWPGVHWSWQAALFPAVQPLPGGLVPAVFGNHATLTATVTPPPNSAIPTGTVDFFDQTTQTDLGTVPLQTVNGMAQATLTASGLTADDHDILETYSGDQNYPRASTTFTENVNQATPTLSVSDSGGSYNGNPFVATATATDVNGNSAPSLEGVVPAVTYFAGDSAIGTPLLEAPTQAGTYTVVASFPGSQDYEGAQSNPEKFTITPVATISDSGNQTNNAGDSVSVPVMAWASNGDPVTLSATGLPPGLSISDGAISGAIASNAGSSTPYTVTITATDVLANVSASVSFTWTVNPPVVTVTLGNPGSQTSTAGNAVSLPLTAYVSNGDLPTFSETGLPAGLTISNGAISGTIASDAGSSTPYTVTITATDPLTGVSATQSFTWTVNAATETITFTNPGNQATTPGGMVSLTLMAYASNGDMSTYSATGLPPGLSISSGGISGTIASNAGYDTEYTVTITATDSITGINASVSLIWTV
jgi:hypothetical protein